MVRWNELEAFLLELAAQDLAGSGEVRPCLAAYAGQAPLLLAFLRPFARGAYADPIVELLALAMPLGADRLAFCVGGRASSWDDPLPPVVAGVGDLRQRVVVITGAKGSGADVVRFSSVHPFTLEAAQVAWAPPLRERESSWIGDALGVAVRCRHELSADAALIRSQARRCTALGHLLAFDPAVVERLRLDDRVTPPRC
ncbi:MAG: hypothetical protein GEU74_00835 [Nitriliruptorales bacterium]|nr:hypothetical protein [Nitriliruptorales bacterium]